MPGAVLFGGEQEAAHRGEILGLVRKVDDHRILETLLTGEDGPLSWPCQQKDICPITTLVDTRGIDLMDLHLIEGSEAWADTVIVMGQHQLMCFGKHLMCQVEE